jgi:hypothetical protein
MRRDLKITALTAVLVGLLSPAVRAEVRAVTDRYGVYKMTRVLQGARGSVWGPTGRSTSHHALNLDGDRNGDLYPTIRESTTAPYYPWVVWSRYNQAQYDLAWSRWSDQGWEPVVWLAPTGQLQGDSLDPDVRFDRTGRPYVAWWRNQGGTGRVFLSLFLDTAWMKPFAVSDSGVDSRHPSLEVRDSSALTVRYDTRDGVVEQVIMMDLPVTITDDINPLNHIQKGPRQLITEK